MNETAFHNLPPVNCRRVRMKRSKEYEIVYSPELQVLALHHANAKTRGPTYVELKKLQTPAQLLGIIALVEERAPELLTRFVRALDSTIYRTFGFTLKELGRGRDGLRLNWTSKIVTRRR